MYSKICNNGNINKITLPQNIGERDYNLEQSNINWKAKNKSSNI